MNASPEATANPGEITIRHDVRPGDIGAIVGMHGRLYADEYGFDHTFEAYVAEPLAACVLRSNERERIWIAERENRIVGCIAIVEVNASIAQLRWYLVHPEARGLGLGRKLMEIAIAFSKHEQYESIILWTVSALTAASAIYRSFGFRKTGSLAHRMWGVDVTEEKYEQRW
jgi:ribosomal protein S18 acetylase RimI-like enzyme